MKKRTPAVRSESSTPSAAPSPGDLDGERVRLNRYLALNGIASRRHADRLIEEGEVMVDGEIVTELGLRIDPGRQRVEVDGVVLRPEGERRRYYLLNKPTGVVCTSDPRENRPRAVDLIADRRKGRIYTVGRLDEDTTGLVILTNDGDFANRIAHPRYGIRKTYRVTVRGRVDGDRLKRLRDGVRLSDFRSSFERVHLVKRSDRQTTLLVTLSEGRNREIRRAFARLDLPVMRLRRVEIGPLRERGLKVGHWRPLTREEVRGLLDAGAEAQATPRESRARAGARGGAKPRRPDRSRRGAFRD